MAGSIEQRGKNTYRLIVSDGYGIGGKRKRYTKTVQCKNKTEAQKELARFVVEIESGGNVNVQKMTFEAFSEKWITDYAEPNLMPKTIYVYKGYLNSKINPCIGHLELTCITPIILLDFYKHLQVDYRKKDGKPLSMNSIIKYHKLINTIFKSAIDWDLVKTNPASKIKPGKAVKPKVEYYNEEELQTLLVAILEAPLKYRSAVMITVAAGLRLGELGALKWSNIDFKKLTIEVEKSSQYLPDRGTFEKDPKNETSKRVISVPLSIMDIIREYRVEELEKKLQCGSLWVDNDYMFTQWNGVPMHPHTPSEWFTKFIKRNNLKKITFHQLRHTSATLLINAGLNVKAISARLGHSNASTTLNIYSHALKSMDQVASDKIGNIIFGDNSNESKSVPNNVPK